MTFKIVSWNVNSIRKNIIDDLNKLINNEKPDVFCFQETRGTKIDIEKYMNINFEKLNDYPYRYYSDSIRGHAGVAIWSKIEPTNIELDLFEGSLGRIICLYYTINDKKIALINTYVPNSGIYEERRIIWDEYLYNFIEKINENNYDIIWCGDLNVIREPSIDTSHHITRPIKYIPAGLKQYEIDGFNKIINKFDLIDVFRELNPTQKEFTWFSPKNNNVGWRLDYFIISKNIFKIINNFSHGSKRMSTTSDHTWLILNIN